MRPAAFLAVICFLPSALAAQDSSRLAAGTRYETQIRRYDGRSPGRSILIAAGLHGDEPAGVAAVRRLMNQIEAGAGFSGTLFLLAEANAPAVRAGSRRSESDSDLNRLFPGRADGPPVERLAHELFRFIKTRRIELVVDLHESAPGTPDHAELSKSLVFTVGPAGAPDLVFELEEALGGRFSAASGAPPGSLNREAALRLGVPAISVETPTELTLEERIDLQLEALEAILKLP